MDRILASEAGDPSSNLGGSATSRKDGNTDGKRRQMFRRSRRGKAARERFYFLRIGTPGISPQNAFFHHEFRRVDRMFSVLKKIAARARLRKALRIAAALYIAGTLAFFVLFGLVAYTPLGWKLTEMQVCWAAFGELWDDADAVVVLGGDAQRAADAVKIFNAGKARRIVVSADERAMLDVLAGAKIPPEKICVDDKPRRTIDHPRTIRSCGITPESKIIVASTRLQERRAARLFREAGYTRVQVYSQTREIRFPEMVENGAMLGVSGAVDVFYSYLAWLKYLIVD